MISFNIIYFIPLVSLVIMILGNAFLGRWLANQKGRDSGTWFWLCLFFGVSALLVLGLSQSVDLKKASKKTEEPNNTKIAATWECPKCNSKNNNISYLCLGCGYNFEKSYPNTSASIICPKCNVENMSYRETCKECGYKLY